MTHMVSASDDSARTLPRLAGTTAPVEVHVPTQVPTPPTTRHLYRSQNPSTTAALRRHASFAAATASPVHLTTPSARVPHSQSKSELTIWTYGPWGARAAATPGLKPLQGQGPEGGGWGEGGGLLSYRSLAGAGKGDSSRLWGTQGESRPCSCGPEELVGQCSPPVTRAHQHVMAPLLRRAQARSFCCDWIVAI